MAVEPDNPKIQPDANKAVQGGQETDMLGDLLRQLSPEYNDMRSEEEAAAIVKQTVKQHNDNFYDDLKKNVHHSIVRDRNTDLRKDY